MLILRYASYALISLSLSFLFGFISRAVPNIAMLHIVAIAAIVIGFSVTGTAQLSAVPYYQRSPMVISFALRCAVTVIGYLILIGVGAWLYVPVEVL
jgi:hypothetical protein